MHTNTSDGAAAALASLTSLTKETHMTDQPTLDTAKLAVLDEVHTESAPKATRATHTPAERAIEAVNVLQRRLDKLTKSKAALELQALELEPQVAAMQKRLDYALASPDLPPKALVEPGIVAEEEARHAAHRRLEGQPEEVSAKEFHAQVTGAPWPTETA